MRAHTHTTCTCAQIHTQKSKANPAIYTVMLMGGCVRVYHLMVEGSGGTLGARTVILEACTALLQGTSPIPRRICPALTQECLFGLGWAHTCTHTHAHTHAHTHTYTHTYTIHTHTHTCIHPQTHTTHAHIHIDFQITSAITFYNMLWGML